MIITRIDSTSTIQPVWIKHIAAMRVASETCLQCESEQSFLYSAEHQNYFVIFLYK